MFFSDVIMLLDWIQENQLSDFDLSSKSFPVKKLNTFSNQRKKKDDLHVSLVSQK